MAALCERQYLDGCNAGVHLRKQRLKLLHGGRDVAERSAESRLVDDRPQPRAFCRVQAILSTESGREKLVYLLLALVRVAQAEQGVSVPGGLKQPGNRCCRVLLDDSGIGFEPHVPAVLAGVPFEPNETPHAREHQSGLQSVVKCRTQAGVQVFAVFEARKLGLVEAHTLRQLVEADARLLARPPDLGAESVLRRPIRLQWARLKSHVQPPVLREFPATARPQESVVRMLLLRYTR